MDAAVRRCYIHIGLPKSGTSFLQSVLWQSQDELAGQGCAMLPSRRKDHFTVALQLRGLLQEFDDEDAWGSLERLVEDAAQCSAHNTVLSQEALAPSTPDQVRVLLEALDGYEVHVIVTARDLARQIPSAWQQRVQARHTYRFPVFLDAVVRRAPLADDFWVNQDLVDVLTRWRAHVAPDRIHLVVNPQPGSPPTTLLHRFCQVIGIDPSAMHVQMPASNPSLGYVQAELQRRVNLALGDKFPHPRAGYGRLGKTYLAGRVLQPQGGRRPTMPERLRDWCDETTNAWVEHIRAGGYDVVGDLSELRPAVSAYADQEEPSDAELLAAGVRALATVLEIRDVELEERNKLRQQLRKLRRQSVPSRQSDVATASWGRRTIGKVRRRVD